MLHPSQILCTCMCMRAHTHTHTRMHTHTHTHAYTHTPASFVEVEPVHCPVQPEVSFSLFSSSCPLDSLPDQLWNDNMEGTWGMTWGLLTLNSIIKKGQKELVVHQKCLFKSPQPTNILRDLYCCMRKNRINRNTVCFGVVLHQLLMLYLHGLL